MIVIINVKQNGLNMTLSFVTLLIDLISKLLILNWQNNFIKLKTKKHLENIEY